MRQCHRPSLRRRLLAMLLRLELLEAALAENGVALPDLVTAAHILKRDYAEQVVRGALAPVVGARRIIEVYHCVDRLLPDLPGAYVGDNFGIARLYGLEDAWCE